MRRRRLPLGVIVPIALVLLVGTLGALQYRWLGQVSQAERDQLRTSLTQRAREFSDDFDREIDLIRTSLQTSAMDLADGQYEPFAARYDQWRERARFPGLVRGVYYVRLSAGDDELFVYTPDRRVFESSMWPEALSIVRDRLRPPTEVERGSGRGATQAFTFSSLPIMSDVPAIAIQLPAMSRKQIESAAAASDAAVPAPLIRARPGNGTLQFSQMVMSIRADRAYVIAHLDDAQLRGTVLPALAERHFPDQGAERYRVLIVDAARRPVLHRHLGADEVIDPADADVIAPFFGLRLETSAGAEAGRVMAWSLSAGSRSMVVPKLPAERDHVSVFLEERGTATVTRTMGIVPASWQLLLQHADGSLEAAVANARIRNLWLSFSILSVLAASVALIVLNARRSERLAARQMDFVATVSHELRTPLTVIRSAAQNLSAGVVHDADGARRYGDLIDSEGRRLTDMVEQVLEYAGLSGDRRPVRVQPVDVGQLVDDVMSASGPLLDAREFEVQQTVAAGLPPMLADPDAIRRALNNLVTNAIKHGADGRWIGVSASTAVHRGRPEVRISVSDHGRGIDPDDLPHVFEPFYRGRHALDRQVQGNGLGLSLVRRIAETHGGRVSVTSAPGQGSIFTLHVPAVSADAAMQPLPDPSPDATGPAR